MTDGYYKCDRCGKFEKGTISNGSGFSPVDYSKEDHRRISFGHLRGKDDTGSTRKRVDLCHECRKELTEWISEGGD